MLIEQLGEKEAADTIVNAIQKNILDGKVKTYDMGGKSTTSDVGRRYCKDNKGRIIQTPPFIYIFFLIKI